MQGGAKQSGSDIDVAVKFNTKIEPKKLLELQQNLEEITKKDIDLIDLDSNIGDSFRYEILINGKTIYCKDSFKFDLYKLDMYREYLELNESRQEIINAIKRGEGIYGK